MLPEAEVFTAFVPLPFTLCDAIFCDVIISNGKMPLLLEAVKELCTAAETVLGVTSIFATEN